MTDSSHQPPEQHEVWIASLFRWRCGGGSSKVSNWYMRSHQHDTGLQIMFVPLFLTKCTAEGAHNRSLKRFCGRSGEECKAVQIYPMKEDRNHENCKKNI